MQIGRRGVEACLDVEWLLSAQLAHELFCDQDFLRTALKLGQLAVDIRHVCPKLTERLPLGYGFRTRGTPSVVDGPPLQTGPVQIGSLGSGDVPDARAAARGQCGARGVRGIRLALAATGIARPHRAAA